MIPCGHSYCLECSEGLHQCALCRKRLVHGYLKVKNYALASFIDKVRETPPTQTKDQQVQTEVHRTVKPRTVIVDRQEQNGLATKPNKQSFQLKFTKDDSGGLKRLEVVFK